MSAVGHSPPPFFKRGPAPLAQLAFFIALSLMLLVLDLRFRTLEWARFVVATVVHPVQRTTALPIEAASEAGAYLSELAALRAENADLKRRQLAVANLLLRQEHLEQENHRLRAFLDMKARQPVGSKAAEILYSARDPFSRRVIINKGMGDGITMGQPVIDDVGVVGQVTRVFPATSEVTLLTDKNQAIPVQIRRNGLRAVLAGAGAGMMELRFLAANADVQPGDILVTSGLDGVYLPGLPVAKVSRIDRDTSYAFARIVCEPVAGVERYGHVLVLGLPESLSPPPPDEPVEPEKAGKGRKGGRKGAAP